MNEKPSRPAWLGGAFGMAGGKRKRKAPLTGSLRAAIAAVAKALSTLPVSGMIIGGVAVIARGVPRTTRDVDLTVEGGKLELPDLVAQLQRLGLAPRIDDAIGFAVANQVLLLRHTPSGVDLDLSIAWLPFEVEAIAAAELLELAGAQVRVARAEDLVIYKAVAFRPQDQQDIERLITLHGDTMDFVRVRRIVTQFAQALDEPDRVVQVEQLLTRVLDSKR